MKKKKIIYIIGGIVIFAILLVVVYKSFVLSITYDDMFAPSTSYYVKINKLTKNLKVKEEHTGSTTDENDSYTEEGSVTLTHEEYDKIMKLLNIEDKSLLMSALSELSMDDKIFYSSLEDASYYTAKEEFDLIDSNHDGKITYREEGNNFLDVLLEENKLN